MGTSNPVLMGGGGSQLGVPPSSPDGGTPSHRPGGVPHSLEGWRYPPVGKDGGTPHKPDGVPPPSRGVD